MSKLTATHIRNAKTQDKDYKLSDGHGLYFHVAKSGKRTWRYRFKIGGKESTFNLGEYPQMTLEQARAARMEARELVKQGINPSQKRREEKQALIEEEQATRENKKNTFAFIAMEWIGQQRERWSRDHANAVLATLKADAFPLIGHHPVDTISPPMVLNVLRRIESRDAPEIASKVLQRMNAVFRYAVQTGRATFNPAADMRGVLKKRKVNHRPAISREELPQFLKDLSQGDIHITTKLALHFVILTAARSGEVRGATWDEVNLEEKLWKVPANRMKMESPHTVPLSRQAAAILERVGRLYGYEGYLFPGIRKHSNPLSEATAYSSESDHRFQSKPVTQSS